MSDSEENPEDVEDVVDEGDDSEEDEDSEDEENAPPKMSDTKLRKMRLGQKLLNYLNEYKAILIVGIDNVGSNQMQKVRIALRGRAEMLMGKNTVMRKVMNDVIEEHPEYAALIKNLRGNIGLVFTNEDLLEIRSVILENKVPAGAKTGAIAPVDVYVPPGPTGLDPGQTSFFQALSIATKISRGSIEILNTVHLIAVGSKVSASAVALLAKLNIRPFFYGIKVEKVFENGDCYSCEVLDYTDDTLIQKFANAIRKIAAIGMMAKYPCMVTLPHYFGNAFKKLVAISMATDYVFEQSKIYKEMFENPDAFKSEAAADGGDGGDGDKKEEEKKVEEEESEESEGGVGGFGLFGDDEDAGDGDY